MKIITKDQLKEMLENVKGATFVNIVTKTELKMNKGGRAGVPVNPYYGEIFKMVSANVTINSDYENAVNNKLVKENKEADFVKSESKWGVKVDGTPLVEHKGDFYVEVIFGKQLSKSLIHKISDDEMVEITNEPLSQWLPKDNSDSISEHQGLDNEVVLRRYKLDSILEISYNKEKYKIQD